MTIGGLTGENLKLYKVDGNGIGVHENDYPVIAGSFNFSYVGFISGSTWYLTQVVNGVESLPSNSVTFP